MILFGIMAGQTLQLFAMLLLFFIPILLGILMSNTKNSNVSDNNSQTDRDSLHFPERKRVRTYCGTPMKKESRSYLVGKIWCTDEYWKCTNCNRETS